VPLIVVHARFDEGDAYAAYDECGELVFQMHEEDDPFGDWLLLCQRRYGMIWQDERVFVHGCRRSEAAMMPTLEQFYGGPREVKSVSRLNGPDAGKLGRLALSIERGRASIEGRKPRRFRGIAVRYA
jgi:hypothetical protein